MTDGTDQVTTETMIARDGPEPRGYHGPILTEEFFAGRRNEKYQVTPVVCASDKCLVFAPVRMQSLQQK